MSSTSPHRLRPVVIASNVLMAAVTGAAVLTTTIDPGQPSPARGRGAVIALTSADPIGIDQGVSITPAPGWELVDRGPNWVTLADTDAGAKMRVTVKTAGAGDVAAVLQADIDNEVANTSLINLAPSDEIKSKTVQGGHFQRAARVHYTADERAGIDTTHLMGVFMELLNPSSRLSAFIDYRESDESPSQIGGVAEAMINSML